MNKNITKINPAQVAAYRRACEASQDIMLQLAKSKKDVLVIGGYQASLGVKKHFGVPALVYTNKGTETIFERGEHGLKRIVWLFAMTRPTQQALYWIQQEKIELVIIGKQGEDLTENSIRNENDYLQTQQIDLNRDEQMQLEYARHIMLQKTQGQANTLRKYAHMFNNAEKNASDIEGLSRWYEQAGNRWTQTKQSQMVLEANCANIYFESWHGLQVKWVKEDEKMINPKYRAYENRADHDTLENKRAHQPVNALLNFAYHSVEKRLRRCCLKAGIKTTLSFYHANSAQQDTNAKRESLLFDLIEPLRPMIEAAILKFLDKNALHIEWFIVDEYKVVHLNHMLVELLTMWLEREILDSMIEEVVGEYCQFLRTNTFTISQEKRATGRKTTATRKARKLAA